MAYRFVHGIDYGPRRGTLGWNIHMAEGGDGTVGWLAKRVTETASQWRDRVSGVSASFVILTGGEVVQMVGWDRAAGNLNPNDRSTDKAFYGRRFLLDVLGAHWTDPNAYTLSAEICGFRAEGPSRAQVESMVKLVAESRQRFPNMVGAFGHADQTDTKGCPGTSPLMRELWTRIGHGKFATTTEETDVAQAFITDETPKEIMVAAGAKWYDLDGKTIVGTTGSAGLGLRPSPYGVGPTVRAMFATVENRRRVVLVIPSEVRDAPKPSSDYAVSVAVGGQTIAGTVKLP